MGAGNGVLSSRRKDPEARPKKVKLRWVKTRAVIIKRDSGEGESMDKRQVKNQGGLGFLEGLETLVGG